MLIQHHSDTHPVITQFLNFKCLNFATVLVSILKIMQVFTQLPKLGSSRSEVDINRQEE